MAQATTYQCPNCRGVMTFDPNSGVLRCAHCGYVPAATGQAGGQGIPVGPGGSGAVGSVAYGHARNADDFLRNARWDASAPSSTVGASAMTYACPACAAQVVADANVVSTECPYCGNVMLVSGQATHADMPESLVPFSVDKRAAEERMQEHFEHKWYLPREFSARLEHMQGVYVPYHLYTMDVSGWATYLGRRTETYRDAEGNFKSRPHYYDVRRAGHARFVRIPVDGSSKMPDAHMDAISPFDFSGLRAFSADYVAGYLAEVADEGADQCAPKAVARAAASFEAGLARDAASGLDSVDVQQHQTDVTEVGREYCMLPVWLMHCSWESEEMLFAVNGQTGRCVGDLPVDSKRRILTIAGVLVLSVIITLFVALVLLGEGHGGSSEGTLPRTLFAIGISGLVTFLVDGALMRQMRTAVEAGDANGSYAATGLVVTDRQCRRRGGFHG